jgi:2-oxoglutarate dehydrogenase E1 component
LQEIFASYEGATEVFWTQEEPQNMGGWAFVEPRLRQILPEGFGLRYVGRAASASPATGSYAIHELEQKQIVEESIIKDSEEISAASKPEITEKIAPAGA